MSKRGSGEGTVYHSERLDRWVTQMRMPDGKRRTWYAPSQTAALKTLKTVTSEIEAGKPVPVGRETVGRFLLRWLGDLEANKSVRATTLRRYRLDVERNLIPVLGRIKLNALTAADVQKMLTALTTEKGLSPNSVKHCRAVLRAALSQAERENLTGTNRAKQVRIPSAEQHTVIALTPEAAVSVLAAFRGDMYESLITLAMLTGLRQGELLGLSWADVELTEPATLRVRQQLQHHKGGYALVATKSAQSRRTLSLNQTAVQALRAERSRQAAAQLAAGKHWQNTGLVFTGGRGEVLRGTQITKHFQSQLRSAGIAPMRFHDLRHGCASLLLGKGAGLRTVMEQLGHSTFTLTANTYAHIAPEVLRDAADRLEEVFGERA